MEIKIITFFNENLSPICDIFIGAQLIAIEVD